MYVYKYIHTQKECIVISSVKLCMYEVILSHGAGRKTGKQSVCLSGWITGCECCIDFSRK